MWRQEGRNERKSTYIHESAQLVPRNLDAHPCPILFQERLVLVEGDRARNCPTCQKNEKVRLKLSLFNFLHVSWLLQVCHKTVDHRHFRGTGIYTIWQCSEKCRDKRERSITTCHCFISYLLNCHAMRPYKQVPQHFQERLFLPCSRYVAEVIL